MSDEYEEINQKPEALFTTEQVAEYLSINKMTVYRWVKEGKLKAVQLGKRLRIPVSELRRIVSETQERLKT